MRKVEIGTLYKHFKGHIYKVIDIVNDCESTSDKLEKVVIYENIEDHIRWARKYNDFISLVDKEKYPDIKQKYRFEKIKSVNKC